MLAILYVCAIAGLAAAIPPADGRTPKPQYSANLKVGDLAPAFSLTRSDGRTHRLSDYKGKSGVLAWFPKGLHRGLNGRVQVAP
jgi:hypothetical protein